MNITDTIRKAIEASSKSRYQIADETKLSQSHLSRLMSGERGLGVDALERLAKALELEITIKPKPKRKKR